MFLIDSRVPEVEMNAPPPVVHRPHLMPIEPSWFVAIGLIILACLPHQIPSLGRQMLQHPIGLLLFAILTIYIGMKAPVLGAAMAIFLVGINLATPTAVMEGFRPVVEGFMPTVLNKDVVETNAQHSKKRWLAEEMLFEVPEAVQEKSDHTYLSYDAVTGDQWAVETTLGENPLAVQEANIVTEDPFYDSQPSRSH